MTDEISEILDEITRNQKSNLEALKEIKKQSGITLQDLEAIQKRELEIIYQIDSIISEKE